MIRDNEIYKPAPPQEPTADLREPRESSIRLDPARSSGRYADSFETLVALARIAGRLDDQSDWLKHFHAHFKDLQLLVVNIANRIDSIMKKEELGPILDKILADNAEAKAELTDRIAELDAKVTELQTAVENADNLPQDIVDKVNAVAASSKELADIVPNESEPTDPTEPTEPEQPEQPQEPTDPANPEQPADPAQNQ